MLRFIRIVDYTEGLAIGARYITVSTSELGRETKASAHAVCTPIMKLNKAIPIEKTYRGH